MENENIEITKEKKKKGKKKWIIIAIIFILIIAVSSSSSEPTVEPIENNTSSENNSETTIETTIDATKEIKAGSSVSNNQVKITYKSCNADFKNYSRYADLKSNHKVIQAIFDFENISSVDISLNGFDCYADGVKCDSFWYVDDYSDPVLTTISAGRKLTDATIYFEVPTNAEIIELEYQPDFWDSDKYIFIVE